MVKVAITLLVVAGLALMILTWRDDDVRADLDETISPQETVDNVIEESAGTLKTIKDFTKQAHGQLAESEARVINAIPQDDLRLVSASLGAADKIVAELGPERILRWRPVLIDPSNLTGDMTDDTYTPKSELLLTFFPGEEYLFAVQRAEHSPYTQTITWLGKAEPPNEGTVEIHVLRKSSNAGDYQAYIQYSSRFRDFNVIGTDYDGVYVSMEINRAAPLSHH